MMGVKSGFTRIPVIEDNIDHVIGIINIKDLFLHKITSDTRIDVRKIMTNRILFRKIKN